MAKIFIDLGAHNGGTVAKALREFPDFDLYIGYEPVKVLYDEAVAKFAGNNRVRLYNFAVDVQKDNLVEVIFYEDMSDAKDGSTFFKDKITGKLKPARCLSIPIDQVFGGISRDDHVILSLDIEGKEYDILEYLLDSGLMKLVDKLYCEWHQNRIPSIHEERHKQLVKRLQQEGFDVTGESRDEFGYKRALDLRHRLGGFLHQSLRWMQSCV